jgi:hypothetical protein
MKKQLVWVAALALGLVACGEPRDSAAESFDAGRQMDSPDVAAGTPPDDTGVNGMNTPVAPSSSERDLEITQQIRQRITGANDFSTDAQNVQVIAQNSVVTLRGPVETDREKQAIAAIARETAGVTRVDDQLEVATP